jgi:hypothetical protein
MTTTTTELKQYRAEVVQIGRRMGMSIWTFLDATDKLLQAEAARNTVQAGQ